MASGSSAPSLFPPLTSHPHHLPPPPGPITLPIIATQVGEVKFCVRKVPLAPASVPGKIEAFEAEQQGLYNRMDHLCSDPPLDDLAARLVSQERLTVRVYVLRGLALRPSNSKGTADPYVVCELGNKRVGDARDAIKGTLYPPFYKMFEFRQVLPGAGTLRIKVFEQSQSLLAAADGDEIIGQTEVRATRAARSTGAARASDDAGSTDCRRRQLSLVAVAACSLPFPSPPPYLLFRLPISASLP